MELKVVCQCGQKYKLDVDPVQGRMPYAVKCPICNTDGTAMANALLAQSAPPAIAPAPPSPPPPPPPISGGLRITHAAPPAMAAPAGLTAQAIAPPLTGGKVKVAGEFNLGLGITGAVVGAALGAGLLLAFDHFAGFRFPLTGVVVGALSGYLGRLLGKGGNSTVGVVSAIVSAAAVSATLFMIYGEIPPITIISIVIGTSFAWRIASK